MKNGPLVKEEMLFKEIVDNWRTTGKDPSYYLTLFVSIEL